MKTAIVRSFVSLGLFFTLRGAIANAQMMHKEVSPSTQSFQRLEQPLWLKGAVTAGGFGLIGLELWWFLFSKPQSR